MVNLLYKKEKKLKSKEETVEEQNLKKVSYRPTERAGKEEEAGNIGEK